MLDLCSTYAWPMLGLCSKHPSFSTDKVLNGTIFHSIPTHSPPGAHAQPMLGASVSFPQPIYNSHLDLRAMFVSHLATEDIGWANSD